MKIEIKTNYEEIMNGKQVILALRYFSQNGNMDFADVKRNVINVFSKIVHEVSPIMIGADTKEKFIDEIINIMNSTDKVLDIKQDIIECNKNYYIYDYILYVSLIDFSFVYKYLRTFFSRRMYDNTSGCIPESDMFEFNYLSILRREEKSSFCVNSSSFDNTLKNKLLSFSYVPYLKVSLCSSKSYSRKTKMKIGLELTKNVVNEINSGDNDVIHLLSTSYFSPDFIFRERASDLEGKICFIKKAKGIKATIINGVLVIFDGKKSFDNNINYIENLSLLDTNIKFVVINQYNLQNNLLFDNNMISFCNMINNNKAIIIKSLNKEKILSFRNEFDYNKISKTFKGYVNYSIYKDRRSNNCETFTTFIRKPENESLFIGYFLSVYDKNDDKNSLSNIYNIIFSSYTGNRELFEENIVKYRDSLLQINNNNEDDLLSKWFRDCINSSKSNDDGILLAFKNMKKQLEEEYKNLLLYTKHYNYNNLCAVPKVVLDKKMEKEYYNTIHLMPKKVIINKINNKKIKPIEEIENFVHYLVPVKDIMVQGDISLKNFYNNKENKIYIQYKEMKGVVINDKIKNRR